MLALDLFILPFLSSVSIIPKIRNQFVVYAQADCPAGMTQDVYGNCRSTGTAGAVISQQASMKCEAETDSDLRKECFEKMAKTNSDQDGAYDPDKLSYMKFKGMEGTESIIHSLLGVYLASSMFETFKLKKKGKCKLPKSYTMLMLGAGSWILTDAISYITYKIKLNKAKKDYTSSIQDSAPRTDQDLKQESAHDQQLAAFDFLIGKEKSFKSLQEVRKWGNVTAGTLFTTATIFAIIEKLKKAQGYDADALLNSCAAGTKEKLAGEEQQKDLDKVKAAEEDVDEAKRKTEKAAENLEAAEEKYKNAGCNEPGRSSSADCISLKQSVDTAKSRKERADKSLAKADKILEEANHDLTKGDQRAKDEKLKEKADKKVEKAGDKLTDANNEYDAADKEVKQNCTKNNEQSQLCQNSVAKRKRAKQNVLDATKKRDSAIENQKEIQDRLEDPANYKGSQGEYEKEKNALDKREMKKLEENKTTQQLEDEFNKSNCEQDNSRYCRRLSEVIEFKKNKQTKLSPLNKEIQDLEWRASGSCKAPDGTPIDDFDACMDSLNQDKKLLEQLKRQRAEIQGTSVADDFTSLSTDLQGSTNSVPQSNISPQLNGTNLFDLTEAQKAIDIDSLFDDQDKFEILEKFETNKTRLKSCPPPYQITGSTSGYKVQCNNGSSILLNKNSILDNLIKPHLRDNELKEIQENEEINELISQLEKSIEQQIPQEDRSLFFSNISRILNATINNILPQKAHANGMGTLMGAAGAIPTIMGVLKMFKRKSKEALGEHGGTEAVKLEGKMTKWLNKSLGRMTAGILMAVFSAATIRNSHRKIKNTKTHIDSLEKSKSEIETLGSTGFDQCNSEDRRNPGVPACFCYVSSGQINYSHANTQVCSALLNGSMAAKTDYSDTTATAGVSGCVNKQNQFDPSCTCRQQQTNTGNNCMKIRLPSNFSGAGSLSFLGNAQNGLNALTNGQFAGANASYASAFNGALKAKKVLDKMAKKEKYKKSLGKTVQLSRKIAKGYTDRIKKGLGAQGLKNLTSSPAPVNAANAINQVKKDLADLKKENRIIKSSIKKTGSVKSSKSDDDDFDIFGDDVSKRFDQKEISKVMDQKFDYTKAQINNRKDQNIFKVLSNRYRQTGLKRLFDDKDK